MSADDGPIARREVAHRLFAAEYDDADLEHAESDEERAPNYVVTPTGARVNRLFVVGVLTEIETVGDGVLRGRVVDPTGAFVIYAGQYQPDSANFLERAEPPAYVAVTGKARTFRPEDGDRVYTSVRPEAINEVTADTRDHWTIQAAEHTLDRVEAMRSALDRDARGEALESALLEAGRPAALAAGIPLALAHYGTGHEYLDAVERLAVEALEVVAGERENVEGLDVEPGAGAVAPVGASNTSENGDSAAAEAPADVPEGDGDADPTAGSVEPDAAPPESTEADPAESGSAGSESATEPETDADTDATDAVDATDTEEHYDLDEAERQEVEETYGTDFETGNEVDDPGEADIESPGPAAPDDSVEDGSTDSSASDAEDEDAGDDAADVEETEGNLAEDDDGEADEDELEDPEEDVEDLVVATMRTLDDGDGADRGAVIDDVVDAYDIDPEAVDEAITSALMDGRCYEPSDDTLKAI